MSTYRNRTYVFSIHGQRWYDRRRQRRQRHQQDQRCRHVETPDFERPIIETPADQLAAQQVAHHDNLLRTFDRMKGSNGRAPGPDGLTYNDFSRGEMAAVLRTVARRIQDGTYRPDQARRLPIRKSSSGYRILSLRNLVDRIVSKAIADALDSEHEA